MLLPDPPAKNVDSARGNKDFSGNPHLADAVLTPRGPERIPADQSPTLPSESCQHFWPDGTFRYDVFGPRQHLQALHPENARTHNGLRKGVVSFAQRVVDGKKNWREWTVPVGGDAIYQAEEILRAGGEDVYISQQAFTRWRGIADLAALGSNYVDLDYHQCVKWQEKRPGDVAAAVLDKLDEGGIPLPSYILSTGRGLVCVWLTELLPPMALPRWSLLQKTLAGTLTEFGADKRALDAARVFRLAGSTNSKAERDRHHVGMIWCQGTPDAPTRHQFSTLADEVLPHTQAEIVSLRAKRVARKAEREGRTKQATQKLTGATYWSGVHDDLQSLRRYRNPVTGTLPPGQRDIWLFVAANALSWIDAVDDMEREVRILSMQAAGWSESESKARLSAVVKRARQAAAGKMALYNGHEVDTRYRMRADTIVDWLQIEPTEMRAADLRVLIDTDRRREREAERQTESRRRRGAKDQSEQKAARMELGRQCLYLSVKDGMSRDDLAGHFGVSTGQISKAMKESRAANE